MEQLVIADVHLGLRIDQLLAKQFPSHSRSYFQSLIDDGFVLLNGDPVKKQTRPELGDEVFIDFQETPLLDIKPEDIPLEILYEDDQIIAVNKPAGMVVHPAPGSYTGTFANALMHHCIHIEKEGFELLRPGIVHRLDKDTTGVLVAAKTMSAHQALSLQFSSRSVEKTYLVICCGTPQQGEFSSPIKRHPIKRKQMHVAEDGKEAISSFKVLGKKGGLSVVEVKLITGRTHQIRVHLKHMNCPVLGDPIYGSESLNRKWKVTKQLLHAQSMKIIHPRSQIPLKLFAPLPEDMKNFIDQILAS